LAQACPGPPVTGACGKACNPLMVVLCRVCQRSRSQYTCPRCEVAYCSLDCYRAHGAQCTESFYRREVEAELRARSATGEERRRLERIVLELSRLGETPDGGADGQPDSGSDDSDDQSEGQHRLEALAERARRGELCAEDLSEEEARRFHAELKSGSLGRALGAWEPWWLRAAVVELDALDGDDGASAGPEVAHLCCAGGRSANPLVAMTVLESLYAYAHAMRAFNGEWAWDPLQVASHLLHLARAVATRRVYRSAEESLQAARSAAASLPGGGPGAAFDVLCLRDVARLVARRAGSAARALLEASAIVSGARELASSDGSSSRAVSGLLKSAKKLEFLASFAAHHEDDISSRAAEVQSVVDLHTAALELAQRAKEHRELDGIAVPVPD